MSDLSVRAVTEADVRDFAAWRYEPPFDGYNVTQPVDEAVGYFLRPSTNCHVILCEGELEGFFTFGSDAMVPGGDYSAPGLDLGLGMRPSLTGRGYGRSFVEAVVHFAGEASDVDRLRVTIAVENQRALRVWSSAGFAETQRFHSPEPVMGSDTFVVLEKS